MHCSIIERNEPRLADWSLSTRATASDQREAQHSDFHLTLPPCARRAPAVPCQSECIARIAIETL
jgi:hypothetical protein